VVGIKGGGGNHLEKGRQKKVRGGTNQGGEWIEETRVGVLLVSPEKDVTYG